MKTYMGEEEIMRLNAALANDKSYTVEFLESLPEDVRAEVIDGQLIYAEAPTRVHQKLLIFLGYEIERYIREHKGECELYMGPFGVRLDRDNKTLVEPDLVVVCDKEKLDDKGCNGAPDFVVEIISPGSRSKDCILKRNKYQAAGVREYWILDWERKQILVYRFEQELMEEYTFQDKIRIGIFRDLEIDFSMFAI